MPRSPRVNDAMRRRSTAAIQQAALEEFAARGYHGATVARVAERAGVAKGLVYNYFPSKDDLLAALVAERLRAAATAAAAAPTPATPAAALSRRVDHAVARAVEERDFYRLYFALLLQPDLAPVIARAEAALGTELDAEAGRLAAVFGAVSDSPQLDLLLFQLALNGLGLALLVRPELAKQPDAFPLDALRERLVALFLARGVAPGPRTAAVPAASAAAHPAAPVRPPRATRRQSTRDA